MDIYCPRCGEPWDLDELHDVPNLTFNQAQTLFFTEGCGVLFSSKPCPQTKTQRAQVSSLLYDILGNDIDGIAAESEDLNL